jgi:protein-disulfide isomerase
VSVPVSTRTPLSWISLLCRLVMAGVLGYAALSKIGDPAATVRAVRAYQILPEAVVGPFGHALPWVELGVAALLLVGLAVRIAGAAAAVLMTLFVSGIASAAARGLRIDCGCFGGGGVTAHPHYTGELVRDVLLLGVSLAVVLIPRSRLAVDPQLPEPVPDVDPAAGRDAERKHRAAVNRWNAEQHDVSRRRLLLGGVGSALVVVMAVAGIAVGHSSAVAGIVVTPTGATAAGGIIVGSPTAPNHVIAYEDPQCPVCGEFEKLSGATLAKAVAEGKVSVEYRMMSFLGPESVRAVAALGAAADEGKFEQLRTAMYANQPEEHTGGYTIADLLSLGRGVGLTDQAFVTAVTKQTYAPWADQVEDKASKANIVGTPTVLLDGKSLDLQTVLFNPTAFAKVLGVS